MSEGLHPETLFRWSDLHVKAFDVTAVVQIEFPAVSKNRVSVPVATGDKSDGKRCAVHAAPGVQGGLVPAMSDQRETFSVQNFLQLRGCTENVPRVDAGAGVVPALW